MLEIGLCDTDAGVSAMNAISSSDQPDCMGQQGKRRVEKAKIGQRHHRCLAVAFVEFIHLNLRFGAVCVDAGLVAVRHVDGALPASLIGVKGVFQTDPDPHTSIRAALPAVEQRFVVVEAFEIVIVGMGADIGHGNQTIAHVAGDLAASLHKAPHIDHGGRATQQALGIAKTACRARLMRRSAPCAWG
jgi:hypothetical protein